MTEYEASIMETLNEDMEYLKEEGYEVLGVFLYGSQNYQTSIEESSDFDVKAIVIPSPTQMILGNINIKLTVDGTNGTLTAFDIYSMHHSIKKQAINFLEILFTKYKIINPKYEKLYEDMFTYRERIARINPSAGVECIYGMAQNKIDKVFTRVPSNEKRIDKFGYDPKSLSEIIRLNEFLSRYINGEMYEKCLIPRHPEEIIAIKKGMPGLTPEAAKFVMDDTLRIMKFVRDTYKEDHPEPKLDMETIEGVDEITTDCCKAYLKERCYLENWPTLQY